MGESQDPEFQKECLRPIDEEPTRVMPNEMEKLVRELPRDTEIVALFKRISDECMIAKVWPCNYCTYAFSAATAFCAFM